MSADRKEYVREWKRANPERVAASRARCREREVEQRRAHYWLNRDAMVARQRARFSSQTPEQRAKRAERVKDYRLVRLASGFDEKAQGRKYFAANAERMRERRRQRIEHDANFRIKETLRSRVRIAVSLGCGKKARKTMELIGCSVEFLRGYLEARFLPGMSWDNFGRTGWHIDHIIPCAEFDMRVPAQQLQCFHYSNLRPLWARDNLVKGARVPASHQAELI